MPVVLTRVVVLVDKYETFLVYKNLANAQPLDLVSARKRRNQVRLSVTKLADQVGCRALYW
jgi:hypothetical protein